jgi:hypothetical protein
MSVETVFGGSVIINRPILEVYSYVEDVNSIVEWFPFYTEVAIIPPRRDSKVSFRAKMALKPLLNWGPIIYVDVIDYVPGRRISYRNLDIGITITIEFQPALRGTLVTTTELLWGWQAVVFGLIAQPLRLIVNDLIMQSLVSLKRRAEARAVDVRPLVFFNYRRSSEYVGGRIYDTLCQEFGIGYVFRDFESIAGGIQWREGIDKALKQCKVIIAHIHDGWEDEIASRMGETDWVRDELERALNQGRDITLIPVFTSDKSDFNMADRLRHVEDTLPAELKIKKALGNHQGILLRTDPDFRQDMERLLQAVWVAIQIDGGWGRTASRIQAQPEAGP